ncbi:MAG: LppX_LprAFG lipoprotein [Marmoricola sp.]
MRLDLRRGAAVTTLLLALGGVAACGNDAAPSASGPAGGASTTAAPVLTRTGFASTMTDAIGRYHSAHVALALGSQLHAVGDIDYDGTTPQMQLEMTFSGRKVDVRLVDGTAYLAVPGLTPDGKFLAVTADDATMGPLVDQLKNFAPDGAISMLKGAVKDFKDAGTTTIDGQQVHHYVVTVDPSALAKKLQLPAGVQTPSLPTGVTEDLYVDSRNLLRRAQLDLAGQKVTIDATKWGEPVHVTAPPASKVVTHPSGLGALAG